MKHRNWRRGIVAVLIVAGALLMWLSPDTRSGTLVMLAGLALEALGIGIDHHA